MFIHEVQTGESLFIVSNKYEIPIDEIRLVNGLDQASIVPGQSLLIPLNTYIVQPGDTLFTIAKRAFVTLEQLRAANPAVNTAAMQPGRRITIPDIADYPVSVLSYYVIRSPELDQDIIREYAPYSTYISLFGYHFSENGDILNDLNDLTAIETTWRRRSTPLATITNLTPEEFSPELAQEVLNNPTARGNLLNNIVYLATTKGYGGVNIDFERVRAEDRDLFTGFLRELRDRLRPSGLLLTIAVPAKTSEDIPWLAGYDFGGIGSVVDIMFIMAYDFHHAGSEPGPVAPIDEMRRTIEFTISRVPKNKVIIGMPFYGYDWVIPDTQENVASAISNQNAVETAIRYQATIHYSNQYESPFFRYTDQEGNAHEVWFEDVESMMTKAMLIREYELQGLGAWQITLGFAQGPWILRKLFIIKKV
ncbi:glycoside hydrolase family 18 protein [Sediminibacillus massiliensis]|uniref:glycoside hydrolase family 18 protein n=1 Tax=Sediminibacillus massiliensis TaxID=1926277 RepID=UPI00098844BE|nr:glycoside hydrolase family 18 protein [Sediminibacillus massiliensis]